jgi:hypothetical protein
VEQSAQERRGELLDNLPLPLGHPECPLVLAARNVLGEEAGPVLPGDGDDRASGNEAGMRTPTGLHPAHQPDDVVGDPGISQVVVDVQAVDVSALCADVAVAEIPPEKRRIGLTIELPVLAHRTSCGAVCLPTGQSATLVEPAPAADGLHCHAVRNGVLGIGNTVVRRGQCTGYQVVRANVSHGGTLPPTTDEKVPGAGFEPARPFGQ